MNQPLTPDGMRLLEELQAAIRAVENEAASRESQAALPSPMPEAQDNRMTPRIAPASLAFESFDRACLRADLLASKGETELAEVEAALKQWLTAAEALSARLDSVVYKLDQGQ